MIRRTSVIASLALMAALSWSVVVPAQSTAEVALRAAIETEEIKGDLKKALEQYRKLASGKDRAVAAQASVRLAKVYQRQGNAEAKRVYEHILKAFPEQKDAVAIARAELNLTTAGEFRQRLVLAGDDLDPLNTAVSPDGRLLATLKHEESAGTTLVIRDLSTGAVRPVTESTPANGKPYMNSPVFSPDGRQLVYQWCGDTCEVRVIALQEPGIPKFRTLYRGRWADTMAWTPDSRSVVVFRTYDDKTADIAVLAAADGAARVLTRTPSNYSRMFVSPDGNYLALDHKASPTDERFDIFVMPMSGGAETPVVDHTAEDRLVGWSPDGRHLLFASDRHTGAPALFALGFANGRPDSTPRLLYADMGRGSVFSYGVTKTGALFYTGLRTPNGYSEIQTASIDLATGRVGTPTAVGGERFGSNDSPAWSPDGKSLAYVSTSGGTGTPLLIIRDMERGTTREVRPALRRFQNLRWSPDGRSILAQGLQTGNGVGIYRIDVETAEATQIVAGGTQAAWSRDGASIYYRQGNDRTGMTFVARDLATGREREMLRGPGLGNLVLSPDGRYIATGITDTVANTRTIVLLPTSGGDPTVLRVNKPSGGGVSFWMPDSRAIVISDGSKQWRHTLDGTQTPFADRVLPGEQRAFHPDGTRVAFVQSVVAEQASEPGVYVLENFLSKPRDK